MRFDDKEGYGSAEESELPMMLASGGDLEIEAAIQEEDLHLPASERRLYWTIGVRWTDQKLYRIVMARDASIKRYRNLSQLLIVIRRAKPSLRTLNLPLYPG